MLLENFIIEINKSYEYLLDSFELFEKDPQKFNEFAETQIAYGVHYESPKSIPYESAFIYLKYKSMELREKINVTKFFFESGALSTSSNDDILSDFEYFKDGGIDELISFDLEIERRLNNEIGDVRELTNIIKRKPGPKRKDECRLNLYEQSKLFYFLAETETIPGKGNNSHISEIQARKTGIGSEDARKKMNDDLGMNDETKNRIIQQLNATIQAIKDFN